MVEHLTEKPGAMLTWVQVPGAARDFSPKVSFQCRPSYSVHTVPMSINICAHVKNPTHWQPYHCLDTRQYCTHWLEWVALLLRLLHLTQVWQPEFPARDEEVLKKEK